MICLMACSSSEEPVTTTMTTMDGMTPIAFRDAYTAQPTRSSAAYSAEQGIDAGQSIGVYAYYHDNTTWSAAAVPNFMWNQQATCLEKGDNFSYSPLKYWPNESDDKLSFMAYFPYTDVAADPESAESPTKTGLTPLMANSDAGLPSFRFTVKESADNQVDFLVSELLPDLPNGTGAVSPGNADDRSTLTVTDRVRFLFHHMTSKVEFRIVAATEVRKDIAHFHLKSLSVSNLYKDGKLTSTYNTSTGETSYAWSEQSAKHGTSPAYTFPLKTMTGYLMMPQTLSDDVKLSISYDVTFKSDGTTYTYDGEGRLVPQQDYTYSNDATIQLNTMKRTGTDTPLTEWLPNHHYVYYIRIGAETIEFTGQVVEWLDEVEIDDIEIQEP
jgi:hypothetical protein